MSNKTSGFQSGEGQSANPKAESFPIPQYGRAVPGADYILRPGGYAVIFNAAAEVAVVATPVGMALPGGGQDEGESPEEAAVRETREECGLRITLGPRVGVADELVYAADERRYYRKRCVFFLAEIVEKLGAGEPDHELRWLSSEEAAVKLLHESQRWAVNEACHHRRTCHD